MSGQRYLRPPQTAEYLGVSESTLAKMRLAGNGPRYSKLSPRMVVYDVAVLDEWVKARERLSTSDAGGER
jgi:predicted DNA-binding transcriptional regulator AlpA